jgi:adenylate kinase
METIVFLGIQGSGKGTQALLLSQKIHYQHINIGDLLRAQIAAQSDIGKRVKTVIDAGNLVQDDLIFELISSSIDPACPGIIFDGFPRTKVQAEHLLEHFRVKTVILLELTEKIAQIRMGARLNCPNCKATYNKLSKAPKVEMICDECGSKLAQRDDDSPEAIQKRFEEFRLQTFPLIELFEERHLLKRVPANGSIEDIFAEVCRKLDLK